MIEELKCLGGTLCHFKLPRQLSSFVSAKDTLTSPSLFSVFVSTPFSGDNKHELGFSVWMIFK